MKAPKARSRSKDSTRERLLRAAEKLIFDHGAASLSIRRIASKARVNSALIRYYFGSMQGLIGELARLNAESITERRSQMLDAIADRGGAPPLADILDAYLRPLWHEAAFTRGERALVVVDEILSHCSDRIRVSTYEKFRSGIDRTVVALQSCLPDLDAETIDWRLGFLGAAALDVPPRSHAHGVKGMPGKRAAPQAEDIRFAQLFDFALGALSAPHSSA